MKYQGSDLHLKVGQPPMMRLHGVIRRMEMRPLTQEDMERLFFPVMKQHYVTTLKETGGADFAYIIGDDECRFRVNLFYQRGKLSLVARRVSPKPVFEEWTQRIYAISASLPISIMGRRHFPTGYCIARARS